MNITTEEIREAYQATGDGLDYKQRFFERGNEFDRWLDEVKAAAWEEGAKALVERENSSGGAEGSKLANPYRNAEI